MLEIRNGTPFEVALVPGLDRDGVEHATVVVKGTFTLAARGDALPVADRQLPVALADVHTSDDAAKSSLRCASEAVPAKGATDVALVGHATSPRGAVESLDVELHVGAVRKVVRVFGDRSWESHFGIKRPSRPRPFERMPLVYEHAFGGADVTHEDPAKHAYEPRNPVGTGFTLARRGTSVKDLPLPNLEDPRQLISAPRDRPAPAGFGFIAPGWMPRRGYAGTYDAAWQRERCPFLPEDFDPRFFQSAHPDLVHPGHLVGGERVRVVHALPGGEVGFPVPRRRFEVSVDMRGEVTPHATVLDTLLIETDEGRVVCTWKATFPCPRRFLHIDWLRIRETV